MTDRLGSPRSAVIVAALLCVSGSIFVGELTSEPGPSGVALLLDGVLGVLACVAFPLLPVGSTGPTVAVIALSAIAPPVIPVAGSAVLGAATSRRLRTAIALGAGAVGAQIVLGAWRPLVGVGLGWWTLVAVASYAAVIGWGAWYQAHRSLVRSLEERARRAEADQAARAASARRHERERIAREMHDVLAHRLSVLATTAGAIAYAPDSPTEDLTRAVENIRRSARAALEDLRVVIGVLRSDEDNPVDWPSHARPVLDSLEQLVEEWRAAGASVDLDVDGLRDPDRLPDVAGRTVYRVVQESVTNAAKHAAGRPVGVALQGRPGDAVVVVVENPDAAAGSERRAAAEAEADAELPGAGSGLIGLAERVELAGGTFDSGPQDGGYRVTASIPWPA